MNFSLNEEQNALKESARRFLSERSGSEQVREAMATESGFDPKLWSVITQELGWTAVSIPESYGGFGLSFVALTVLMEEMGYALMCGPFFSSICLAANTVLQAGDEAQRQRFLPDLASGRTTGALAYLESSGRLGREDCQTTARRDGAEYVLSGEKSFVIDGCSADWIIVSATGEDESIGLYLVAKDTPGLTTQLCPTMDLTRPQSTVQLNDLRVAAELRLGSGEDSFAALTAALDLGAIALAAEQMGGAQRCLDMAVSYAKERVQFGRTIGSFQAIKHMCADMMLEVESARSACYYAGWAATNKPDALTQTASMVRSYCSDAFFHSAGQALQIHGGIGFTWEHDLHLYFKRAQGTRLLMGSPSEHRERIAATLFPDSEL